MSWNTVRLPPPFPFCWPRSGDFPREVCPDRACGHAHNHVTAHQTFSLCPAHAKAKYNTANRAGRLTLVNCKLSAMPILHMMALDLPAWFFKCIDKLRRRFFWKGVEDAKGGCCMVAWSIVCTPKPYGGLGVLNLPMLNQALRIRWFWFEMTVMDKP